MPVTNATIIGLSFALILTIVVELLVIRLFKKRSKRLIMTSIGINFLTNVSMNILLIFVFVNHYVMALIILELIVFVVEALAYRVILKNYKDAFTISLACNSASLAVGLAFNFLMWSQVLFIIFYAVSSLFSGMFNYVNPGDIIDIQFYTTDYEEIIGDIYDIYAFETYDASLLSNMHTYQTKLNSPAPIQAYYTIAVEEGDDIIIRFTIESKSDEYSFENINIDHHIYSRSDVYQVIQSDELIYVDILYENISQTDYSYQLYDIYYATVSIDANGTTRKLILNDPVFYSLHGYCFFFGDLNDLDSLVNV